MGKSGKGKKGEEEEGKKKSRWDSGEAEASFHDGREQEAGGMRESAGITGSPKSLARGSKYWHDQGNDADRFRVAD